MNFAAEQFTFFVGDLGFCSYPTVLRDKDSIFPLDKKTNIKKIYFYLSTYILGLILGQNSHILNILDDTDFYRSTVLIQACLFRQDNIWLCSF